MLAITEVRIELAIPRHACASLRLLHLLLVAHLDLVLLSLFEGDDLLKIQQQTLRKLVGAHAKARDFNSLLVQP